jgi:hypothetical protein
VIVSPSLAFAARHVLEGHWQRHEQRPMPISGEIFGRFTFILVQLVEQQANLWSVIRLWTSDISDIVLLRLTPYSADAAEYKFRHLTLGLLPPNVGEHITAFG